MTCDKVETGDSGRGFSSGVDGKRMVGLRCAMVARPTLSRVMVVVEPTGNNLLSAVGCVRGPLSVVSVSLETVAVELKLELASAMKENSRM